MSTSTASRHRRALDFDVMSEVSGYTGDEEEEDMMTTTSTDDDEYRSMKSSPFFHVAPRKRKRNVSSSSCGYRGDYQMAHQHALPPIEPYKTSLYVLSRFLTNHMAQTQTQTNGFTKEEPRTLIQEEDSVRVDSIPCILSGQHLFLEDTLSFSPLPRILLEADRPHRVVHANAAYARGHGKEKEFQCVGHDLELAVMELFPSLGAREVVMYPVWGSDRKADGSLQQVTHYLVEARPVFDMNQHQQVMG